MRIGGETRLSPRALRRIAGGKGVSLPSKLDDTGEKEIDQLQGLSGAKFDKAYSNKQVSDHKKAIEAFEKEAKSGLKAFAGDTVPTLKEHLKHALAAQSAAQSDRESQVKSKSAPDHQKSQDKASAEPDRKSQ